MIVVLGNSKNQVLLFFEYIEKGTLPGIEALKK